MNSLPDDLPVIQDWKAKATEARFFGIPVGSLQRDDLLAVIGHLLEESESKLTRANQRGDFYESLVQSLQKRLGH